MKLERTLRAINRHFRDVSKIELDINSLTNEAKKQMQIAEQAKVKAQNLIEASKELIQERKDTLDHVYELIETMPNESQIELSQQWQEAAKKLNDGK